HPRQRSRRVVLPDVRRDPLGLRRQDHRQALGARDHEGRRHGRNAGVLPPPGLQPEALDAAGVGERLAPSRLPEPEGRGAGGSGEVRTLRGPLRGASALWHGPAQRTGRARPWESAMALSKQAMTDEQRKSVALEYLKAFDKGGVTSSGGSILDLF